MQVPAPGLAAAKVASPKLAASPAPSSGLFDPVNISEANPEVVAPESAKMPTPSAVTRFQPRVLAGQSLAHAHAHTSGAPGMLPHAEHTPSTHVISVMAPDPLSGFTTRPAAAEVLASTEDVDMPSAAPPAPAASAPAPVVTHVLPWMVREDADDEMPVITDPMYHSFDTNITDEYDAAIPNDYEALCEVSERRCTACML